MIVELVVALDVLSVALDVATLLHAKARSFPFLFFLLSSSSFLSCLLSFFRRVCFSIDGFSVIELTRPANFSLLVSLPARTISRIDVD